MGCVYPSPVRLGTAEVVVRSGTTAGATVGVVGELEQSPAVQQQPRHIQEAIQEAVMTRTPGTPLGIRLQPFQGGVFVQGIDENGVVWAWNATHPERKLAAGDRLIMVNGLQVETTWPSWCAVLAELRRTTVTLVVVRPQLSPNHEREEDSPLPEFLEAQASNSLDHLLPDGFMDTLPRGTAAECGVTECCICLEDLEPTEEVVLLPCKHVFHPGCAETWLTRVPTLMCAKCPMCRQHLPLQLKQQQDSPLTTAIAPVVGAVTARDTAPAAVDTAPAAVDTSPAAVEP